MSHVLRTLAPIALATVLASAAQAQTMIGGGKSAPTFPIFISQPGSYKLAGNLVVPASTDAIVVNANNVTIDLNGFSITGPGYCAGQLSNITCSATAARGISVANTNIQRMVVRNGLLGGFGICLEARYAARVSDLSMHDCNTALIAFDGSVVSQVAIQRSGDGGALYGSSVESVQVAYARSGFATAGSTLRNVSMLGVYSAFALSGNTNSALSQSVINATMLGNGVQSVGGNLCNGVAC